MYRLLPEKVRVLTFSNLHVSKCMHVACLACWEKSLANALECPACRARTRLKQVQPLQEQDKQEIISKLRFSKPSASQREHFKATQ